MPRRLVAVVLLFVLAGAGTALAQTTSPAPAYDALIQQGKAQLQAHHAAQALAAGERAIKLDAKNWEGYALAGGALMNLKRYDEAITRFGDAMERAPQDKQAGLNELRRQCFAAESGALPVGAVPPSPPVNSPAPEATTTQAEIVLWKSIENSTNPDDFQGYLKQYPRGAFAALAQGRVSELKKQQAQKNWQAMVDRGVYIGVVSDVKGNAISITTDAGPTTTVTVPRSAHVLRIHSGQMTLDGAQKAAISDISAGDRILIKISGNPPSVETVVITPKSANASQ